MTCSNLFSLYFQNNYKIQATRLTHEIDDLRRRLENAKMKLTAEMKVCRLTDHTVNPLCMSLIYLLHDKGITSLICFPFSNIGDTVQTFFYLYKEDINGDTSDQSFFSLRLLILLYGVMILFFYFD